MGMYLHAGRYSPCTAIREGGTLFQNRHHGDDSMVGALLSLRQSASFSAAFVPHSVLRENATHRCLAAVVVFASTSGFGSHESATLRNVPGSQVHEDLSARLSRHFSCSSPSGDISTEQASSFDGHARHSTLSLAGWYSPVLHGLQNGIPEAFWYSPVPHGMHSIAPGLDWC